MAMITKIEPQYAPQGHILSLKVDVKNEKIEQTLVKIGISVSDGKKTSDSDDNVPSRFTDVIIPAQQALTVDLLLDKPVLPAEEAIRLIVSLSQKKSSGQ